MKYLIQHYDTFYYRRKLHYKIICVSLKTKNISEAKYILSIINSKIEIMREIMNINEENEYIKNLLKKYIDIAKEEYSELSDKREQKYTYTKKNGKLLLGSHPKAIKYHINELQDYVYSNDREQKAQEIINDSNIQEDYIEALKILSPKSREKLVIEVIKAELELLNYDKDRNEERTNPKKLNNTYINNEYISSYIDRQDYDTSQKSIETDIEKYKTKNKEEVLEDYLEKVSKQKRNMLDKVLQPVYILFQSANHKYLVDYEIEDYERFFDSLIYIPKYLSETSKLYKAYEGNYIQIANDFKESVYGEENLLSDFFPSTEELIKKIQSKSNVEGKLIEITNFLTYCESNDYIKKNYMLNNKKFSTKRFEDILKSTKQRQPFNDNELNLIFSKFEKNIKDFKVEEILIPLIALFQGLRVEEICKLRVQDIKQDSKTNIYYFDIEGEVKSDNSVRKSPIHSQLIEKFEILKYVKNKKENNADMLFDLKSVFHKKKQKFSHYFLRDFFTPLRNSIISENRIEEDLISFHSFRHSFATRLRASRVDLFAISNLLGHKVSTVAQVFFQIKFKENSTPTYTKENIELLKEDIEKLQLNDIQDSLNKLEIAYKTNF